MIGDYFGGLCGDYYRDPFPHSLLGTRQFTVSKHGDGCGNA